MKDVFQPPGKLTRTGAFLNLLTGVVTLTFAISLPLWILPQVLEPGTRYPVIAIAFYAIIFGAGFFTAAKWIVGKLGFPVAIPAKESCTGTDRVV
jgi:hypothetical protein